MKDTVKILFVDDESDILNAIRRVINLRRSGWQAKFIDNPLEAVELIKSENYNIIVSDMRMPQMSGAELLNQARTHSPDTVRILLTGQANMSDTISAINEGQVFRFLTKPCPPEILIEMLEEAFDYHTFLISRSEMLKDSIDSNFQIVVSMMEAFDPDLAKESAARKEEMADFLNHLKLPNTGIAKLAALLARVGEISISSDIRSKVKKGQQLTTAEKEEWNKVPEIGYNLLKEIPQMQEIANIILHQHTLHRDYAAKSKQSPVPIEANILKLLYDKDEMLRRNMIIPDVCERLISKQGHYEPILVKKMRDYLLNVYTYLTKEESSYTKVTVNELKEGDKLYSVIATTEGMVLFSAGTVLTEIMMASIENWHKLQGVIEPIKIVEHRVKDSSTYSNANLIG